MPTIQKIRSPSGDDMVVMSLADYEDIVDAKAARDAKAAIASGEEEMLTEDEVKELLAAPTPLSFWRRKRNLRQGQIAEVLGFAQGYISDIENGRRHGGIKFYRRLVPLLGVPLESLLPPDDDDYEPETSTPDSGRA